MIMINDRNESAFIYERRLVAMRNNWIEISYHQFPSFSSSFQRYDYEMEREDIEETEETEEDECLDLRSKYMSIL